MMAARRSLLQVALALLTLLCLTTTKLAAAATLTVRLPKVAPQNESYRLQVRDDGFARLPLQWSDASTPAPKLLLMLSPFKADGQPPAVVGLRTTQQQDLSRTLQDVELAPDGTEVLLSGADLTPDLDYTGEITASYTDGAAASGQSLSWKITLLRPSSIPPFRCPTGLQIGALDGSTSIDFPRTDPTRELELDVQLTAFLSNQQELGQVGFGKAEPNAPPLVRASKVKLSKDGSFVPAIRTVGLTPGTTYGGKIWFSIGERRVLECAIEIVIPKLPKGELVLDAQTLTRNLTLSPLFGDGADGERTLSVRLFDKDRSHHIDGLAAVLDGVTASPEGSFELPRHVEFLFEGNKVNALGVPRLANSASPASASSGPPALEAGQQLDVGIRMKDLQAGSYAFSLRFRGSNTATEGPKLDVSVNVRDHWFWAVLAEVVALAISFFFSKGIVSWRERMRLRGRVFQMRESMKGTRPDLPSYVFLDAVLAQTLKVLNGQWVLPPPPSVYDFLARGQRVVAILVRYREVTELLRKATTTVAVERYYHRSINQVLSRIGATPLDQKTADAVVAELNAIATQLTEPEVGYWSNMQRLAVSLARDARTAQHLLGDQAVIDPLLDRLEKAGTTPDPRVDSAYWLVRLLYSRKSFPDEIKNLVDAYRPAEDIEAVYKVADASAWARLKEAIAAQTVSIRSTQDPSKLEALYPLKFVLKFVDPALTESYFVNNVATYAWHLRFTGQKKFRFRKPLELSSELTPVETGPRITQYAPFPGKVQLDVTIKWNKQSVKVPTTGSAEFDVAENSELSAQKGFDLSELILMAIMFVVALATGLPALYFSKLTFGSFGDYVAMLTWAIGVDQSKNLIQLMRSYPTDGPPAAATS